MPRICRIFQDNATYHVLARGNQKQTTFLEEADFLRYMDIVRHYKKKYKFKLYGYCLMPNHVHLILEVKNGQDLRKIMQGLNQTYAIWFNKKYKKVGHLWQGRYKCLLIQKSEYLLSCIEYVEMNPIRSNLKSSPFEYPWNSWLGRLGHRKDWLLDLPNII